MYLIICRQKQISAHFQQIFSPSPRHLSAIGAIFSGRSNQEREPIMNRRQILTSTAAAAVTMKFGSAAKAQGSARTFVLVAGAFSGGWIWARVVQRLRAAGHHAYTLSNTGLGERSHLLSHNVTLDTFVKDIAELVEAEELSNAILVGHSFGEFLSAALRNSFRAVSST
jgi:pimeloyl-ACP methyl ester carboxylesterase